MLQAITFARVADKARLIQQVQHNGCTLAAHAAHLGKRGGGGGRAHGSDDAHHLLHARVTPGKEVGLDALVFQAKQQNGTAGLAIAPSAAGLLRIAFKRVGKFKVVDEADVLLVDAEAERLGRDHDARFALMNRACSASRSRLPSLP